MPACLECSTPITPSKLRSSDNHARLHMDVRCRWLLVRAQMTPITTEDRTPSMEAQFPASPEMIAGLCPVCAGSGKHPRHPSIACWKCGGTGAVVLRATPASPEATEGQLAQCLAAFDRQGDNMAFVLNHAELHYWFVQFERELEEDRATISAFRARSAHADIEAGEPAAALKAAFLALCNLPKESLSKQAFEAIEQVGRALAHPSPPIDGLVERLTAAEYALGHEIRIKCEAIADLRAAEARLAASDAAVGALTTALSNIRINVLYGFTVAALAQIDAAISQAQPTAPGDEITPHHYHPSAMHMGDCSVCGNLADVPWHIK